MRLYPDLPARRTVTLTRDALALALVLLFAYLGNLVHDRVADLAALGRGAQEAGTAVQRSLDSAADAVGVTPVIGGQLADGLRQAGRSTAGQVVAQGREGERKANSAANLLGFLVFALPTGLLLARYGPERLRQIRSLTAAEQALGDPDDPERRRAIAARAAYGLPLSTLTRHTRDPLGDLEAGRHDGLVAAALEEAGLDPRRAR